MAMTKSRRAAATRSAKPFFDEWDALSQAAQISDMSDFIQGYRKLVGRAADNLRHLHADNNRVCSYDQATHNSFLGLLALDSALIEILRMNASLLDARVKTLEREFKKAKTLSTKSRDTRFTFDDLQVELIDDRNVRLALVRGDDEASFDLKFPVMIDRGVWSDRGVYERGDAVSHGGSLWVAQRGADLGKPGEGESGWRLAVKAGRPGRDARA